MFTPDNILEQVVTWNMVDLKVFQNLCCAVANANTKLINPASFKGNLGAVINYETPPQLVTKDTLVANFQQIDQNSRSLVINQEKNVSVAGTAEEIIFNNLEEYSKRIGDSAMQALATKVEEDVISVFESNTYRFYGNGSSQINSAQQLATALARFTGYSNAPGVRKVYLDLGAVPAIVNSMQNQFTMERNNENAKTWEVGNWNGAEYFQSNLLKVHLSGECGIQDDTLTVVSHNGDVNGNNITQITFSSALFVSQLGAVKKFDKMQFISAGLYALTYQGSAFTDLSVQVNITADADVSGSNVTVNIFPALNSQAGGQFQNINTNIVAGMQAKIISSHKCGAIVSDNALFVGMPPLPSTYPFPSAQATDPNSGVSVRLYYGTIPFENVYGWTRDCVWGKDLTPQNAMMMAFQIQQNTAVGF